MERKFKIGDKVVIDNLSGGLNGHIGHVGKIVKISSELSSDPMYHLDPHCIGSCWYAKNLKLVSPTSKIEAIFIKVPKI